MTREGLFVTVLLFAGFLDARQVEVGEPSYKESFYDTLVNLSASGSKIKDAYRKSAKSHRKKVAQNATGTGSIKSYYDSMLDEAVERKWALPIVLSYGFENKAFDASGCKGSLSGALFGNGTTIKDVFLLARLSYDDKLQIHPPGGVPSTPVFGHYRYQQYLALIAPAELGLTADQNGFDIGISAMYRFKPFSDRRIFGIVGCNLPIQTQKRTMDSGLKGGSIFNFGFAPNVTVRENVLSQFYKDFIDVKDFFLRAVLGSKGLEFEYCQQKIGIGDISLFGNMEFGPYVTEFENGFCVALDALQVGVNVSFPTGSKSSGTKLWEISFGNGGGFQFTFFGSANFRTSSKIFNPMIQGGIEVNTRFCSGRSGGIRIPQVVSSDAAWVRVTEVPGLATPVFQEYLTLPFEAQNDSTVALFSDTLVTDATVKVGRRWFIGIGDYFYNIFGSQFRLGLFYLYSSKTADQICASSNFDVSSLQYTSKSHRLSWNLTYKCKDSLEFGLGTQHIVAGTNVPEQHQLFVSLALNF